MSFQVIVRHLSGARVKVDESDDLVMAAKAAFDLAGLYRERIANDYHGPPAGVEIYMDDHLKISIWIIEGGLKGTARDPQGPAKISGTPHRLPPQFD